MFWQNIFSEQWNFPQLLYIKIVSISYSSLANLWERFFYILLLSVVFAIVANDQFDIWQKIILSEIES